MEVFGLPLWLVLVLVLVLLIFVYVRSMSAAHNTFKKMGIESPPPTPVLGNFSMVASMGVFDVQTHLYNQYKDKKVYGFYDTSQPVLIIRDLNMVREIMIGQFNKFVNRRGSIKVAPPLDHTLLILKDEEWRRVRNTVTPSFTSGRIKKMVPIINQNIQNLIQNLREKQERNEEVELKDVLSSYTLDVIAATAFGYEVNSQKDPQNKFVTQLKLLNQPNVFLTLLLFFFPKLVSLLSVIGIDALRKDVIADVVKFVDMAIDNKKATGSSEVNTFLDLIIQAEKEESEGSAGSKGRLSRVEMQAQAFTFIVAGMETVASTISFTLFMLAVHPDACHKVHEEIDQKLGKNSPGFENIQTLTYLDMCLNETMRIFPAAFAVDRMCNEDADIEGVHIPKGMPVAVPIYAIHHDPDIWPEPEKFKPERFSAEAKQGRHPSAHLPFGQGNRNCIGMRLGLMEAKMTLAAVLQAFTPVRCEKTVYPVKLAKMQLAAEDGVWVKLESRK